MALTKALVLATNDIAKVAIPNRNFYYSGLTPPDRTGDGFLSAYSQIGWLHAVVFRIALGCSEVEWTLFDVSNQDKPKQIYKHPLLTLLKQVNPFQTSNEFIALDTIYNELIGESFWALNFNALGEPSEIILPYPHKMSVVPAASFPFVKGYVYGTDKDAIPFDVNEIIHFKYPNPLNQYRGLAPARAIGINLDAEQNADKWVNQFFYNSARPDGVIQFDYNLSDEQFDKLKKQWQEKYKGVSKAHQVALLEGGGKYIQIQNSIKDMDFPNLKQKNRDVILGVFGMPQSVMGISENVNKANAEAGDYTFARWIVKPRLDWKKAKIQEQLIPKFRHSENLVIGFKEVVPETTEQKISAAESGMRAGYLTINEARKTQGLDSIPTGDVLLVPLNLIPTPIKEIAKPPAPALAPASEESEEEIQESYKGGEGSGNFGHEGRPGEVGGSGEGGGTSNPKPSGGDSGSGDIETSVNERVSNFESSHAQQSKESCIGIDKNGKVVLSKTGGESEVSFTSEEMKSVENARVFVHNHPAGSSFSDKDLDFACRTNPVEMKVVSNEYNYNLKLLYPAEGWPSTSSALVKTYKTELDRLMPKYSAIYERTQNAEKTNQAHTHEVMSSVADKYTLVYTRTARGK